MDKQYVSSDCGLYSKCCSKLSRGCLSINFKHYKLPDKNTCEAVRVQGLCHLKITAITFDLVLAT